MTLCLIKTHFKSFLAAVMLIGVLATLNACSQGGTTHEYDYPEYGSDKMARERMNELKGGGDTIFGELSIGGPKKRGGAAAGEGFATVNYYLWRATLETLSLGPLESADPFGGVIITDWFSLEEEPGSQYRVTAYILGRQLRTDNIKIALYVRPKGAGNAKMDPRRASAVAEAKLENVILSKARTIRATQFK
jgi:hypothetical protein